MIEGDIVDDVATRVQMEAEASADGLSNAFDAISGRKKWENGVVPYVYGSVGRISFYTYVTSAGYAIELLFIVFSATFKGLRMDRACLEDTLSQFAAFIYLKDDSRGLLLFCDSSSCSHQF